MLLSFATALVYVSNFNRNLGMVALITVLITSAFNVWAFYKQIKRNRKRGLLYYFQPEWQKRVTLGWEDPLNPVSNVGILANGFWLLLLAGVLVRPDSFALRVLLMVFGLCEVVGWAYSTYAFETSEKIYQDNTRFYLGMLSQVGITISLGLATVMFSIRPIVNPINLTPIMIAFALGFMRWILPQRYFGPRAVRVTYKKLDNPGWLWSKSSRSLVYKARVTSQ